MTIQHFIIKKLEFLSPTKETAFLDFRKGANIVCGASETGKSFIIEAIDFMFGSDTELRDIPERVGYSTIRLTVETKSGEQFALERSVGGGNYQLSNVDKNKYSQIETLNATNKLGKLKTLSDWLLSLINVNEKKLRKDKVGNTVRLSFRNLAKLIMVKEGEIVKEISPILTGQYTLQTIEYSLFKFLVTGIDDGSMPPPAKGDSKPKDLSGKVELIEQWLDDLSSEINDTKVGQKDLENQLERIDEGIKKQSDSVKQYQEHLVSVIEKRRSLWKEQEKINARIDEINELLARFDMLKKHYDSDIKRLNAIQESGSLFVYLKTQTCPLCGTIPENQHANENCDVDVNSIVQASTAEIMKIENLIAELEGTVSDIKNEKKAHKDRMSELTSNFNQTDEQIRKKISPQIEAEKSDFIALVEKRSEILSQVNFYRQIEKLEKQRDALLPASGEERGETFSTTDLSKSVLEEFSRKIEEILKLLNFPSTGRVYFDDTTKDIVINGKPRRSWGKGLRAITHAAFTLGLLEYCNEKSLPHPGIVILDSPLLAYYRPEGKDDSLQGTDLKDRFYKYLLDKLPDMQVIILENEHPQPTIEDKINLTIFTKNPTEGRYGFFPIV